MNRVLSDELYLHYRPVVFDFSVFQVVQIDIEYFRHDHLNLSAITPRFVRFNLQRSGTSALRLENGFDVGEGAGTIVPTPPSSGILKRCRTYSAETKPR